MKKIGILLECSPYGGGAFQYARNLYKAIQQVALKRRVDYCAFIANDEWNSFFEGESTRIIGLSDSYVQNLAIIDGEGCDMLFATNPGDWSGLYTPIVTPIHDIMHRYEPQFPEVGEYEEMKEREHLFYKIVENSVGVLVDSNIGKQQVMEIYGRHNEEKIHILPFSVSDYLLEEGTAIDLPFEKYIFYPAQFWRHKNHRNLLYAILKLRDRGIIVNCIFVGSKKNEYDEIIDIIHKYELTKQVGVLGYVSNSQMKYLFKNARAMIMPTFLGPTNIPPIEAMSLGCPVAVSNIYGMPEQLGDAALYFNPNDILSMATVIEDYWIDDELCEKMKKRGLERSEFFSLERFTRDVDRIITKLDLKNEYKKEQLDGLLEFCNTHSRIVIFGAGRYGFVIKKVLEKWNIEFDAFVVSKLERMDCDVNPPIYEFDSLEITDDTGIICSVSGEKQRDIINMIEHRGIKEENYICFDITTLEMMKYKYE